MLSILQEVVWTDRVTPYLRPGCVGLRIARANWQDEGSYNLTVTGQAGQDTVTLTLLVDCEYLA